MALKWRTVDLAKVTRKTANYHVIRSGNKGDFWIGYEKRP
jgi:hypothetical protein